MDLRDRSVAQNSEELKEVFDKERRYGYSSQVFGAEVRMSQRNLTLLTSKTMGRRRSVVEYTIREESTLALQIDEKWPVRFSKNTDQR